MKNSLMKSGIFTVLLSLTALVGTARCGAFDDAEEWGGYWRQFERPYGRRYDVPPTLYYGHAPEAPSHPVARSARDEPLFRRLPPTPDGVEAPTYQPPFYGRGRYFGPSIDPYYAPGRSSYAGTHYGWW